MHTTHAPAFATRSLLTALVLVAVGAATQVQAAGTANDNLSVVATVAATCTITATGGTLNFGPYDPVGNNAATALTGTGSVSTTCTTGSDVKVTLGEGLNKDSGSTASSPLRRMTDGSSHYLTYTLFSDAGMGTVWGNDTNTGLSTTGTGAPSSLTVYGSIPAGQNVPAGSYADTVIATVTF
ncbi:fimbrial major subunit CsuA/B family protein [Xylophilus rhododendri]|uniref:Fimbrial major subunit CsuA/B family protein n=1 Tax=Xylophilus rhododendri TaxID=2697032 RepID=A0A857J7T9_9BURK|nr:spore coat U domain-containing protein [Xylophilus rhododendri]QHI98828.1 fimbrial major subunit CsuA/B family protein [Xylophilus rhododendri]